MTDPIEEYRDKVKKLAHLYGMGVFAQFVMEAKGLDTNNQQITNLQLLDVLREQAEIFVTLIETYGNGDSGL